MNQRNEIESLIIAHKYLQKILARNKYLKRYHKYLKKCLESKMNDKFINPLLHYLHDSSITMDKYVTDYTNNHSNINMNGGYMFFDTHLQYMLGTNKHVSYKKIIEVLQKCIRVSKQVERENESLKNKIHQLNKDAPIKIIWKEFGKMEITKESFVFKKIEPANTSPDAQVDSTAMFKYMEEQRSQSEHATDTYNTVVITSDESPTGESSTFVITSDN